MGWKKGIYLWFKNNYLEKLRKLNLPILIAISRKSFIGTTLNIPDPENRLNGTLSSTAIAVYNGAHIVRTHDVDNQLIEMLKMAQEIRRNKWISILIRKINCENLNW